MNKAQIKAELRRSACEDIDPWWDMRIDALQEAAAWYDKDLYGMNGSDQIRTFFLLVAEAL